MGLGLQADADVLDGAGEEGVGKTRESSREVVLAVAHGFSGGGILGFKGAAGVVVSAELDGHAGADSDEGGEGAFVEGRGAFFFEDLGGAVGGAFVVRGGLQADFDDVEGLADEDLGDAADGAGEEVFEGFVEADVGFFQCLRHYECVVCVYWLCSSERDVLIRRFLGGGRSRAVLVLLSRFCACS